MKYRKKPVVIEAWQNGSREMRPEWLDEAWLDGTLYQDGMGYHIKTLEGIHDVGAHDFIIRGVQGELYPCKPDIFRATYEVVDDD